MVRAPARIRTAPTMRDVAKLAGVSQATVSYVINGRREGQSRISERTQERVLAAMAELNYVPNDAARHLRRDRSDRICLVIGRLGSPFGEALIADVEQVAARHGYTLTIALGGTLEREEQVIEQVRRRLADGLIIEGAKSPAENLRALAQAGVPVVITSNTHTPDGFDVVSSTELEAVALATRHLLDQGHRRIAVLAHTRRPGTMDTRAQQVRETLAEAGVPLPDELLLTGAESRNLAFERVQQLLIRPNPPTALFSASDRGAISAMWAARAAGLTVPADLAVIGSGNIDEGRATWPPLTTIGPDRHQFTEIGELLFARLNGEAPPEGRRLVVPWQLLPRGSAEAAPRPDRQLLPMTRDLDKSASSERR